MTLTRYGLREWGLSLIAAVVLITIFGVLGTLFLPVLWSALAVLTLLAWLALAAFFRSPRRRIPDDPALLVSPADGLVRDIEVVEFDQEPFAGRALRIGIFLSVLNVHVNRASADWQVTTKHYREGRYLDARDPECARENEAMTIAGTAASGEFRFPMAIRQISGAIARRIVCPVEPGRSLRKGEIYGMIKFGSRTELYLPADGSVESAVRIGDKVAAGSTVIARIVKKTA